MKRSTASTHPATVQEKFDLEGATAFGGANLLFDYIHRVGLHKAIQAELYPFTKRYNAVYPLAKVAELLVGGRVLGLSRVHDFALVENDKLLALKVGLPHLPDSSLLYRDIARLTDDEALDALRRISRVPARRVVGKQVILDIDSTVETVYGQLEGAAVGYNPTKHGRASFHPLTFFDGITRAAIRVELRPGNTVAATGLIESFWRAYEEVQRLGATIIAVRADRGFQSNDFFSLLEQLHIDYAIKISMNEKLSAWAADLVFEEIAEDGDEVIEVAEGTHRRSTWSQERRVVVVRRRLSEGLCAGAVYGAQAIVTTLTASPADVYRFYNQRCAMENMIREAKEGYGVDEFSSHGYRENYADLLLKTISYNLGLAFQRDLSALRGAPLQTARTLRRWILNIPGLLVRHARGYTLRLAIHYRRDGQHERMRARLRTLPV